MESILNERKKLYDLIEYIKENNSEEKTSKSMKILKKLLTNIKTSPEELKFRIIKTTNKIINEDLMNTNGILNLLQYLGYIATNDGNFILESSDLNNIELCLNILNTDINIYQEKEYVKTTSQQKQEKTEDKKKKEKKKKKKKKKKKQKERINQLIEDDKKERKNRFTYK